MVAFHVVIDKKLQKKDINREDLNSKLGVISGSFGSGSKTPFQTSYVSEFGVPPLGPGRALINPFDPSHVTVKVTSNRRRWTHIFAKGRYPISGTSY